MDPHSNEPAGGGAGSPERLQQALARDLARSWAGMAQDPRLHGALLTACARNLRQVLAGEQRAGGGEPDDPPMLRWQRRLAVAIDGLGAEYGVAATVADLRILARLSLGECADLLRSPRTLLRRIWRPTRRAIFAAARRAAGDAGGTPSAAGGPQ